MKVRSDQKLRLKRLRGRFFKLLEAGEMSEEQVEEVRRKVNGVDMLLSRAEKMMEDLESLLGVEEEEPEEVQLLN
jgi:hypothetical protein